MVDSSSSSTLTWCDPSFPGFPVLYTHNALYYFCNVSNPFYNTRSLNQQLISQGLAMDPEMLNQAAVATLNATQQQQQQQQQLSNTVTPSSSVNNGTTNGGVPSTVNTMPNSPHPQQSDCIFYQLENEIESRLFIIVEYRRARGQGSSTDAFVEPASIFYILDAVVYQAPILYDIIDSRQQNAVFELEKVLVEMQECLRYGVNGNRCWQFPGDDVSVRLAREEINDEYSIRETPIYPPLIQEHVLNLVEQLEHETYVAMKNKQDKDQT